MSLGQNPDIQNQRLHDLELQLRYFSLPSALGEIPSTKGAENVQYAERILLSCLQIHSIGQPVEEMRQTLNTMNPDNKMETRPKENVYPIYFL